MKKFIKEDLVGLLTCLAIFLVIVLLFVGGFYLAKLIGESDLPLWMKIWLISR